MDTYKFDQNQLNAQPPTNNVQKTSEGFLLDSNEYLQQQKQNYLIIFLIFLIFLIFFWWFFLLIAIFNFVSNKNFRNNLETLKNNLIARFRFLPPEVFLSTYPLSLGEKCSLTFRRHLKGNRKTKQPGELTFKIACLERVTYTKGSDTEVEVEVIWESPPEFYSVPTDVDMICFKTVFMVPNHLPPCFEAKNNQIRWVISVEQKIPGIVEQVYSNFSFVVDPVLLK